MEYRRIPFGETKEGKEAGLYCFTNGSGMQMKVSDYGAALVSVIFRGADGKERDLVLGYDDVSGYEAGAASFGACVGRCANRIGGASFSINGQLYELDKNDGGNNLHSGLQYYNKRLWETVQADEHSVTFSLFSPHMDQGYPGNVNIQVRYTLTEENEIAISYHGETDQDTIINLTNHSYFNLNGHKSGDILKHKVWINADHYTAADAASIPTGELVPVRGTPMDFTVFREIGADIDSPFNALKMAGGYDHNWAVNGTGYRMAAAMCSEESGVMMEVYTDCPGIQFYTGNFLDHERGKNGALYPKRAGACFEAQFFPDAIHHPRFESPVCRRGSVYEQKTVYRFMVH